MEVMFSRYSVTVVDAMWAVCRLPTVQRVASQMEVVLDASSLDALCCACTLFRQCPQIRTICHPVVQQPLPSAMTYRRVETASSSLYLLRAMITGRSVILPCLSSLDHLQLIRFLFRYGGS